MFYNNIILTEFLPWGVAMGVSIYWLIVLVPTLLVATDPTFTVDNVTKVLRKISTQDRMNHLMLYYLPGYQYNEILKRSSSLLTKIQAYAMYIVNHFRDPSWQNLNALFYDFNELASAGAAKSFLPMGKRNLQYS